MCISLLRWRSFWKVNVDNQTNTTDATKIQQMAAEKNPHNFKISKDR